MNNEHLDPSSRNSPTVLVSHSATVEASVVQTQVGEMDNLPRFNHILMKSSKYYRPKFHNISYEIHHKAELRISPLNLVVLRQVLAGLDHLDRVPPVLVHRGPRTVDLEQS